MPGMEKPLTTDQACWYFNERSSYEEFEYENVILILASTSQVRLGVGRVHVFREMEIVYTDVHIY